MLRSAKQVSIYSEKLRRIVRRAVTVADRVIILADADGRPIDRVQERIYQYVDRKYRDMVYVVLLDYEIEEWICHSQGLPIRGKPSDMLKNTRKGYKKNQLPNYAATLDCKRLEGCNSFNRLLAAMDLH